MPDFLNYFVEPGTVTLGLVLVGILIGSPLLAMLFAGTKLVFRFKSNNAAIILSMIGVWFVSLIVLLSISAAQVKHFKDRSSVTTNKVIDCDSCETLYLNIAENKYEDYAELDWDVEGFNVYMVGFVSFTTCNRQAMMFLPLHLCILLVVFQSINQVQVGTS